MADFNRILVVRRDNIGDLVCTTPMLRALRQHYPHAWIGVLANRYNAEVLHDNPDIDEVIAYQKAKHRPPGTSRLAVWLETARLLWRLRREGVDLAVLASSGGERFARLVGARRVLGGKTVRGHEVEACMDLLAPLGIRDEPGVALVRPNPAVVQEVAQRLPAGTKSPVVGIHLSARKVPQRWPEEHFVEFIRTLIASGRAGHVAVFWAPGPEDDPRHPGDDGKAGRVLGALGGLPVTGMPTGALAELVAGLSLCDRVFCSDGGAMHVAAGLGKPIVCLFGNSGAAQWRPWGVPHVLLQPASLDVKDVSVADAVAAWDRLPA